MKDPYMLSHDTYLHHIYNVYSKPLWIYAASWERIDSGDPFFLHDLGEKCGMKIHISKLVVQWYIEPYLIGVSRNGDDQSPCITSLLIGHSIKDFLKVKVFYIDLDILSM